MAGGLFPRLKVWIYQDSLASADLNGEFDNIITHLVPNYIDNYSHSVGEMQTQTSPGSPGSEVLPTSLAGEIAALRYMLSQVIGGTYWYSSVPSSLTALNTSISQLSLFSPNRIVSGAISTNGQPMFLLPAGSGNGLSVTLKASLTPLVCQINGVNYTFSSDITLAGLTAAPSSNNTAAIDNDGTGSAIAAVFASSRTLGEYYAGAVTQAQLLSYQSVLPLKTIGSSVSAKTGSLIAFKTSTELSIGWLQNSAAQIAHCMRGWFFNQSGVWCDRVNVATNDTVTLLNLAWIFLRSGGTLNAVYNQPKVGPTAPSSPSTGDYWYDTVNQQWKIYSVGSFVSDSSIYVGLVCTSSADALGARAADFANQYAPVNSIEVQKDLDTQNVSKGVGQSQRINVYGTNLFFEGSSVRWDASANMDSGITLTSGREMFLYLDKTGKPVITDVSPQYRDDLFGLYHPANPWRCVAKAKNNGTNFTGLINFRNFPLDVRPTMEFTHNSSISISTSASAANVGSAMAFVKRGRPILVTTVPNQSASNGNDLATIDVVFSGAGTCTLSIAIHIVDPKSGTDDIALFGGSITAAGASTQTFRLSTLTNIFDWDKSSISALTNGQFTAQMQATVSTATNVTSITLKNMNPIRFLEL